MQMKLHEKCKQAGLSSLAELVEITEIPKRTLIDWHNNPKYPRRLQAVILGAVELKRQR